MIFMFRLFFADDKMDERWVVGLMGVSDRRDLIDFGIECFESSGDGIRFPFSFGMTGITDDEHESRFDERQKTVNRQDSRFVAGRHVWIATGQIPQVEDDAFEPSDVVCDVGVAVQDEVDVCGGMFFEKSTRGRNRFILNIEGIDAGCHP